MLYTILTPRELCDKDALTKEGVKIILDKLSETFEYIICDSPAGIEHGALMALYYADEAIVVTNPEVSSVRDSDRILGILQSKSFRAENDQPPVKEHLLISRFDPARAARGEMLSIEDIEDILAVPLIGIIPESQAVLNASNNGTPVILDEKSDAGHVEHKLRSKRDFRMLPVMLAAKLLRDHHREAETDRAAETTPRRHRRDFPRHVVLRDQ
jgi:septum site-determining protein MinD